MGWYPYNLVFVRVIRLCLGKWHANNEPSGRKSHGAARLENESYKSAFSRSAYFSCSSLFCQNRKCPWSTFWTLMFSTIPHHSCTRCNSKSPLNASPSLRTVRPLPQNLGTRLTGCSRNRFGMAHDLCGIGRKPRIRPGTGFHHGGTYPCWCQQVRLFGMFHQWKQFNGMGT